jgi:hypothetical protein
MPSDTKEALVAFWKRHGQVLGAVPKEIYDELDGLIRADERAKWVKEKGWLLDDLNEANEAAWSNRKLAEFYEAELKRLHNIPHEKPD